MSDFYQSTLSFLSLASQQATSAANQVACHVQEAALAYPILTLATACVGVKSLVNFCAKKALDKLAGQRLSDTSKVIIAKVTSLAILIPVCAVALPLLGLNPTVQVVAAVSASIFLIDTVLTSLEIFTSLKAQKHKKLISDVNDLNSQIEQLTENNENLTTRNKELTEANRGLIARNKELTENNENLTTRNKELTEHNGNLTESVKFLNQDNDKYVDQIQRLKIQIDELTKKAETTKVRHNSSVISRFLAWNS